MFSNIEELYLMLLLIIVIITVVTMGIKMKKKGGSIDYLKLLLYARISLVEIINKAEVAKNEGKISEQAEKAYIISEINKIVDSNELLLPQEKELIKTNMDSILDLFINKPEIKKIETKK